MTNTSQTMVKKIFIGWYKGRIHASVIPTRWSINFFSISSLSINWALLPALTWKVHDGKVLFDVRNFPSAGWSVTDGGQIIVHSTSGVLVRYPTMSTCSSATGWNIAGKFGLVFQSVVASPLCCCGESRIPAPPIRIRRGFFPLTPAIASRIKRAPFDCTWSLISAPSEILETTASIFLRAAAVVKARSTSALTRVSLSTTLRLADETELESMRARLRTKAVTWWPWDNKVERIYPPVKPVKPNVSTCNTTVNSLSVNVAPCAFLNRGVLVHGVLYHDEETYFLCNNVSVTCRWRTSFM